MTGTAVAAPPQTPDELATTVEPSAPTQPFAALRRPVVACLILLLVYVAASFALNDPRGTLGTDTGGKLATLRMMERSGSLDPDLGYWAERYDPDGVLQPLHYTYRVGDKWVNVTTLPMIVAAYPLYVVGGERAVLLLPMLGAVMCALAAAALARRFRGGDGMRAFWVVGLATPVTIYALDFWEHSIGLALMLWGALFAWDVMERRAGWRAALGAGLLFGLAATMRTEALVYFVVAFGVSCLVMLVRDRNLVRPVVAGVAALAGLFAVLVANRFLEQLVIGSDLRGTRVTQTANATGSGGSVRIKEAFTTSLGLGLSGVTDANAWLIGAVVVGLVAGGAWLLSSRDRVRNVAGGVLLAAAALVYLARFGEGMGFVPGLLMASPFAVVGLVLAWKAPVLRWALVVALVALPIAWVAQYSGGADPQWGGRYLLPSGALLAVAGIVVLREHLRAFVGVLVVSALVTLGGVAWLSVRSHTVADGVETILARDDDMLISRQTHFLREAGAFYDDGRKWLTAVDAPEFADAVGVARATDTAEFAVVHDPGQPQPRRIDGYERGGTQLVSFIRSDVKVAVTTYQRG